MKCTSLYPAPDDTINLLAIDNFIKTFNVPIGYSDHSKDELPSLLAVSLGAKIIEKHQIELDNNVHTKVLLTVAEKKILKLEDDVEDLKNKFRKVNGNQ